MAARPRTLPAAIAPVLVGTAAAYFAVEDVRWLPFAAALAGSILIQIGTNLANDYSDAKRGADTADRLGPGPGHLVRPDRAAPGSARDLDRVRRGARSRASTSRPSPARRSWRWAPSRSPPASSTPAGRGPTATPASASCSCSCSSGSSPSTAPTTSSSRSSTSLPFLLSIPVGFLSTAILVVNNVRDLDTDARAGKRTLAVRLGRERTRTLYAVARGTVLRRCCRSALWLGDGPAAGLARARGRAAGARAARARSATRTDGPALNGALAATGHAARCVRAAALRGPRIWADAGRARGDRSVRASLPRAVRDGLAGC